MNISLNWLQEYVDIDLPTEDLTELLTQTGLNFEGYVETDHDDTVLDLEVTSNRPDWLGHLGVARELAAATEKPFTLPTVTLPAGSDDVNDLTSVTVDAPALCPRYTARIIRNVKVGPSPEWLVKRLEAIGLRSVNNVVDITNFVLMEYSQPLHSFDYDKLAEGRIVVRNARKGETLVSIDETTCELNEEMLVIADANAPIAIAGIMGGLATEVSESTTTILLEAAQFDQLVTRKTSRKLGLFSDSNFRFERHVDPVALEEASRRACEMICDIAGGDMVEGLVDVWQRPWVAPVIELRPARVCKLLGVDIATHTQIEFLTALDIKCDQDGDVIRCEIPSFRADLEREVDLIEEIARLFGYDQLPLEGEVSHPVHAMGTYERIRRRTLEAMTAAGFCESITFTFVDDAEAALFGVDAPVRVDPNVRRTNNALRPSILPSLAAACKKNASLGNSDVHIFELASAFPPATNGSEVPVAEQTQLAMLSTGDLRDLRGGIESLVGALCPDATLEIVSAPAPGLDETISGEVRLNGAAIGAFGRLSQAATKYYNLDAAPAVATLWFAPLVEATNLVRSAHALPKLPPIVRDLSLILDEAVSYGDILGAIQAVDQPLRQSIDYVTTYRGKQIPKGQKSLTLTIEFRSPTATLTREQVQPQMDELITTLKDKFSADVRM
ncbi:MAG: phenylalanine--tRNA ligase subunit beta [Phycisphaerales bacterium]|jgi:phenylalanyl-tRNA synthetase beta chain|nr:phenylalanine--tRNA ligase subunit beta [Phycisphaerales bacterium]